MSLRNALMPWVACLAIAGAWAGCGEGTMGGNPGCIDKDGDGFGVRCGTGADCDDLNASVTNECYACVPGRPGCACQTEGITAKCGIPYEQGCLIGEKVCKGGQWSDCDTTSVTPQYKPMGLGEPSACANNPCDPYCWDFPDTPDNTLNNDAGIIAVDSGLSLDGHPWLPEAGGNVCASESQKAEPYPVDLMLLLDDSGSMAGSKWTSVKSAINSFVFSADAAGIGMGLQFFPLWYEDCWWIFCDWYEECSVAPYQTPRVGIAALPANATPIMNTINADSPGGGTPTRPALEGVINYAKTWANAHTDHKVAVVLASDGEPTGCSSNSLNDVKTVASNGFNGTPSIPTYVIGVGSSLTNLNGVAASGGTGSAYIVNGGDSSAFLAAMQAIRAKSLTCEFNMPTPSAGTIDLNTAKVKYTPNGNGTPQYFTRVDNASLCGSSNSFYYDNNANPTKIILCPTPCNTVKADPYAGINVEFSCKLTCGSETKTAAMLDVDMYIMLDKSGSMQGSRWTAARSALTSFIQSSQSDGLGVGLDYFPDNNDECSTSSYSTPSVAIAKLPGNKTTLVDSLNATNPTGGTPTRVAELGATAYAKTYAQNHSTHKVVVVLVTDGEPNDCSSTVQSVKDAAAAAYNGTPSIPTYVIGVGTSLTNLNGIAASGGTGSAFLVNGGDSSAFLAAMNAIRGQVLSCEYAMPQASAGGIMDPSTLEVGYVPGGNGTPVTLTRVSNAAACGSGHGFYVDNPSNPTKITLCTTTCNAVKADSSARVDIVFDCKKAYDQGWFTRNYDTSTLCGPSQAPTYGNWAWNTTTPDDSRVDFTVAVADSLTGLYMVPKDNLQFTNPPGPAGVVGQAVGAKASTSTQIGAANVDATLKANNRNRQARFIQIQAHLVPSSDQSKAPILHSWDLQVSCKPAE